MNRTGPKTVAPTLSAPASAHADRAVPAWRDWLILTKPEITFLVAITALAGFVLGSTGPFAWGTLAWLLVGVVLTSAGGATLNHVMERRHDRLMRRTAARPLPAGRLSATGATWFGLVLVGAGLGLLCPLTNPLTGVLAAGTVVLYLFVYTPLKRRTTLNTLVGTVPGALPALGGWTAATGQIEAAGWILFAVLVFWQIPHFLALAWMYRGDYARAAFHMLPVIEPDGASTVRQVVGFTALLLLASLGPVAAGLTGPVYGAGAILIGAWFIGPVAGFTRHRSNATARRLLKATVYYIPVLVLLIVVDRLAGL